MAKNQFDTLGALAEVDEPGPRDADALYEPTDVMATARRLTFILFDEIVEDSPTQSRNVVFDPDSHPEDRELLASVQKHGIITPIVVRALGEDPEPDDRMAGKKQGDRAFAVVAGHRRVAAGKAAGLQGTEGVIATSNEDHALLTLAENLGRRELSSYEKALALKTFQEQRGLSGRQVADATGISQSYVQELFQALESPRTLRSLWREEDLSPKAITKLKSHWPLFEKETNRPLLEHVRGLSQRASRELRHHLDAGTGLETALAAMGLLDPEGPGAGKGHKNPHKTGRRKSTPPATDSAPHQRGSNQDKGAISRRERAALNKAMGDVLPGLGENKRKALIDQALASEVADTGVVWAAALYAVRGGDVNQALDLASEAMSRRRIKHLMRQEIKLMKRAAGMLNTVEKKEKGTRAFLDTIFYGIQTPLSQ